MIFVDTNYFLRFLLNDVSTQHETATKLFTQGAKGEVKLCTDVIVFFELYWVFTSFYQKNKQEVIAILHDVLSLSFIEFEERELFLKSLEIFAQTVSNLDLEDCYHLVIAVESKVKKIATFDKKLQNVWKMMENE